MAIVVPDDPDPVAEAPLLETADVAGAEDTAITLDISAALADTDGAETLSVTISGVPAGASLSAGTDTGGGVWVIDGGDLAGGELTLTPPQDFSGNFNLSVEATATEVGGETATTSSTLGVSVSGVADTPSLTVSDVSGSEDTAIPLDIGATLTDLDGSETLSVTISGFPDGATLSVGGAVVAFDPAGTDTGANAITLVDVTQDQLDSLVVTPPANASEDFSLTVTAQSAEDGTTATTTATLAVVVTGVADAPSVAVLDSAGDEDTAISLNPHIIIHSELTDPDGSEVLSVTIAGVPTGATLSAGTDNGGGSWTLTAGDLIGLTITPPADSGADFTLQVSATATETDPDTGAVTTTTTGPTALAVEVTAVADAPGLGVNDASGAEDAAIALDVTSSLNDTDGSEVLSVTFTGVPTGATLSTGTDNGGGSWTLTAGQLDGLSVTPASGSSADFTLQVTATATETDPDTGVVTTAITGPKALAVTVTPVADAPTLDLDSAGDGAPSGPEDGGAITLDLAAAVSDPSEALSLTITGLPQGATLSAGTDNGAGTVTFDAADLAALAAPGAAPPHPHPGA